MIKVKKLNKNLKQDGNDCLGNLSKVKDYGYFMVNKIKDFDQELLNDK